MPHYARPPSEYYICELLLFDHKQRVKTHNVGKSQLDKFCSHTVNFAFITALTDVKD